MNISAEPLSTPAAGRRRFDALMRPGVVLMQQLRIPAKLGIVAASLIVPLCVLMGLSMRTVSSDYAYVGLELAGVRVSERLTPLIAETQRLRGFTRRLQSGDSAAEAPRDDSRRALRVAVTELDAELARGLGYPMEDVWQPLRSRLLSLAEGRDAGRADEVFAGHSDAIDSLRQLGLLSAERSGLVLDPEAHTYFMMDLVVNNFVPLVESVARARGEGTALLAQRDHSQTELAEMLAHVQAIERNVSDTTGRLAALKRAGGQAPGSWLPTQERLLGFTRQIRKTFGDGVPGTPAGDFFNMGSSAADQVVALQGDLHQRLADALVERQRGIVQHAIIQAGSFVAGMLVLAYLMIAFVTTFRGSLNALRRATEAIAQGDLSQHVAIRGRDELAEIGRVVEGMAGRLSALVADIRNSASMLDMTGHQVSEGSARLAQRTDTQASSLRSSVAAIGELSAAVESNAQAARGLDELTQRLSTQAEDGNAAMGETVAAMQRMQLASQRVAEVVSVIDDVAFHTSMLSLNAAVEAARAGEAGKGFAVVATEVRQLAQRCAESAEEIRRLIGDAGEQVEVSASKLQNVSGALGTIVEGVREVSERLRGISASSTQQSAGLKEVTQSVGNLDEITRENASLVEESAGASSALVARASTLREAVVSMRLRQGSSDEALAMVQRAREHLARVGRAQAQVDFHAAETGFVDRDLYLFAIDRGGVFSIFGARPEVVGQPVEAVPGLDRRFVDAVWGASDAGGGWVQYEVLHPLTGQIAPKESYVHDIGDGQAIGCGVYRIEANAGAAKPRAAAFAQSVVRASSGMAA